MRVAVICRRLGPGGGLERYTSMLLDALAARGHDVHAVASRIGPPGPPPGVSAHRLARLPLSAFDLLWFDLASRRVTTRLDPDVSIGLGRTTAQTLHRAGGGCHRVYSRLLHPRRRFGLTNRIELLLERRLYLGGATAHFIVNAAPVADQIVSEYGVAPASVSVVLTPVDHRRCRPARDAEERAAARREFGFAPGEEVFLFVSMEHRRKGLDALLDAWRTSGARLAVAGAPLSRAHRSFVTRAGLAGRVSELGRADLPRLYRAADWLIHPTRYDACSNAVLEALASGLPPIVSARDGVSALIRHGIDGFVLRHPEDPEAIRRAADRAVAIPAEERRRIREAACRAVADLTIDTHIARWEELMVRHGRVTGGTK